MLKSRFLKIVLALSLVLCFMPVPAFADEGDSLIPDALNEQGSGDSGNVGDLPAIQEDDAPESSGDATLPAKDGDDQPSAEGASGDLAAQDAVAKGVENDGAAADGTEESPSEEAEEAEGPAAIVYAAHVSGIGWQHEVRDGKMAGTTGRGLAVEALQVSLDNAEGGVTYRAHVPKIGWQDWVADGETAGTTGQGIALDAIEIELSGEAASLYDVYYRVHSANKGWLGWARNGEPAGTAGYGLQAEAIEISLVEKGASFPGYGASDAFEAPLVSYEAHVQNIGWMRAVNDGDTAGTSGQALRMEALSISLGEPSGSIEYRAHVANVGWQDWVADGAVAGTTGKGNAIEAVQIQLSGEAAALYDVYYRVHSANKGWLGWACNGELAGTSGYGFQTEAIEISLVEKGATLPGYGEEAAYAEPLITYKAHVSNIGWMSTVRDGETGGTIGKNLPLEALSVWNASALTGGAIISQGYVEFEGWQDEVEDGTVGTTGQARALQAVKFSLSGEIADLYDIYYRTHVSGVGWLDWASNGEAAGSVGYGKHLEAVEIVMLPKGSDAPGATENPFQKNSLFHYQAYVQGPGWMSPVGSGVMAGSTGKSLRLEGLSISLGDIEGSIEYRAHVANVGWQDWVADEAIAGTPGKGNAIEALQIQLAGEASELYDVYYRIHSADVGWLGWACNGEVAGTSGCGMRAEAIEIELVDKGAPAPGSTDGAYRELSYSYSANSKSVGWQDPVTSGQTAGTTGESLPIYQISPSTDVIGFSGEMRIAVHSANIGWQDYVGSGEIAGVEGSQVEAIKVELTGDLATYFNVWYRVHASNIGWMGWAKNGEPAGTSSLGYAAEGIQIRILPKYEDAPGSTSLPYRNWRVSDLVRMLNSFSSNGWVVFGTDKWLSSTANRLIDEAIWNYTSGGCDVGFVMIDLITGSGVAYRANSIYTSCCTIKAPYIVSLNKYAPWTLNESEYDMYWSLFNSTNETYYNLIDRYGKSTINRLLAETGAHVSWYAPDYFGSYSSKDLAKMWLSNAEYLLYDGSENAAWLRDVLDSNVTITIRDAISGEDAIYAKSGWISDVHNEGCLVVKDGHPYIIAIMSSSSPSQAWRMEELARALDYVHSELVS